MRIKLMLVFITLSLLVCMEGFGRDKEKGDKQEQGKEQGKNNRIEQWMKHYEERLNWIEKDKEWVKNDLERGGISEEEKTILEELTSKMDELEGIRAKK